VSRVALHRDWRTVTVHGQELRVKVSLVEDGTVRHATPEFEDAAAVARELGLPVRRVLDDASAEARSAGIVPGAPLPEQHP
jgi:pyridinium-3,5-bisthiocarboxylic acid mononucleotide nickel chelatase